MVAKDVEQDVDADYKIVKSSVKLDEIKIMKFLRPYHKYFGIVAILVGIFLVYRGDKHIDLIITAFCALAFTAIVGALSFSVLIRDDAHELAKIAFFCCLAVVGTVIGYGLSRC